MPGKMEAELDNGLIMGHAYSITDVKLVGIDMCTAHSAVATVKKGASYVMYRHH